MRERHKGALLADTQRTLTEPLQFPITNSGQRARNDIDRILEGKSHPLTKWKKEERKRKRKNSTAHTLGQVDSSHTSLAKKIGTADARLHLGTLGQFKQRKVCVLRDAKQ